MLPDVGALRYLAYMSNTILSLSLPGYDTSAFDGCDYDSGYTWNDAPDVDDKLADDATEAVTTFLRGRGFTAFAVAVDGLDVTVTVLTAELAAMPMEESDMTPAEYLTYDLLVDALYGIGCQDWFDYLVEA